MRIEQHDGNSESSHIANGHPEQDDAIVDPNEILNTLTFLAQKQKLDQSLPTVLEIKSSLNAELVRLDSLVKDASAMISDGNYTSALLRLNQSLEGLRSWVASCDFMIDYLNRTTNLSAGFDYHGERLGKFSSNDANKLTQIIDELQTAKTSAGETQETLGRIVDKLLLVVENKTTPLQS